MEYYLARTRNEVLINDTTWKNLEKIILSEESQTQKATYSVIPFIGNNQQNVESTSVVARSWGWGWGMTA